MQFNNKNIGFLTIEPKDTKYFESYKDIQNVEINKDGFFTFTTLDMKQAEAIESQDENKNIIGYVSLYKDETPRYDIFKQIFNGIIEDEETDDERVTFATINKKVLNKFTQGQNDENIV